ncbi:Fic family protein [Gammaproteobacteria bacterium AB-CW1]|uniref:Protein adenylyltransferase n=1 Tax=Natronospira elongata TaxID=3110268 RepID=A0AAP6JH54_9GAMM|nr:Fic family protein [Gammaproteobacteria bacterium AB-CW1]
MSWRPDQAYNELPPLPPPIEAVETRAVLKACIPARAALAELRQAGELLPDQGLLVNLLPMLEARDSSEIENIFTTTEKLFRHARHERGADPATREALRYRKALEEGCRLLDSRPVCTAMAVELCSLIQDRPMEIRRLPGTVIDDAARDEVIYTPPEGEDRIRELLANWETFVHGEDDLDPLIRMAVSHYQFEATHPFMDGNGRTGRLLNVLMLMERGLLTLPILYLSRYIVKNKADYYRLLLGVTRDGAWEEWILFMLNGVEQVSTWTCDKVAAIRALMDDTSAYVRQQLPRIYSHELMQVIFEQPYCRISSLVERDIAKRQTASVYLKDLASIGVLKEEKAGKEKLFVNPKLMRLMSQESHEFEAWKTS